MFDSLWITCLCSLSLCFLALIYFLLTLLFNPPSFSPLHPLGFADIPSGPACPYIVRRGLLGTAVVPVSQKDAEQDETD